jgi:hypothetical protein
MELEEAAMRENHGVIQKVINDMEQLIGTSIRTTITLIECPDAKHPLLVPYWIVKIPLFWTEWTYRISLYSMLLRSLLFYKEGDVMTFLKTKTEASDQMMWRTVVAKLQKILEGNRFEDNWNPDPGSMSYYHWHNRGICGTAEI